MSSFKDIRVEDFRYDLPPDRIARYPLGERDISKLLVYRRGLISDDLFYNIGNYLDDTQTLIFNSTRVIRSRLLFRKSTGASIEIFCLEPHDPSDYEQSLGSKGGVVWKAIVGNLKKWKEGPLFMELTLSGERCKLTAEKVSDNRNEILVRFTWNNPNISFSEILEGSGHIPVPPYLNRDDEPIDNTRYQTVYSDMQGSVAAPTAGLHFSEKVLKDLKKRGVDSGYVTLHVGAGTFIPVKSDLIGEHTMHEEHFFVSRRCVESLARNNIIAVGTTSVRTLETLYHLGCKLINGYKPSGTIMEMGQWEAYTANQSHDVGKSVSALVNYMDSNQLDNLHVATSIIIVPGYRFRIVKGIVTNYHMPSSTLLLLVSAFIGDDWREVYNHALENDYRFLSYGDSSLLLP